MTTDYSSYTDQELMTLLKARDSAAFTEVYDRYAVLMFYKVNQMLRDEESSKDLVQDLFIKLWDRTDLIQVHNNLSGYLYVSARNSVLKQLQRSKLKNDYLSALTKYVSVVSMDTLNDIDERELAAVIQQEIDQLPIKMKIVFEMSRKENLSHAEIAEKLGISDQTVKKHVNNALKILRSKLSTYMPAALMLLELAKKN